MSFEAVPCMFKSRQEDGAEAFSLGLLIRQTSLVAAAIGVEDVIEKQQQQQITLPSSSCNQPTAPTTAKNSVPFAQAGSSSSPNIGPNDASTPQKQSATSLSATTATTTTSTTAMFAPQLVQLQQRPIGLLAPPSMPPILPRPPKQQQQLHNRNNKKGTKTGTKTKVTTAKEQLPILPRKTTTMASTNLTKAAMVVPIPVAATSTIAVTAVTTGTGSGIITNSGSSAIEAVKSPTQIVSTQPSNVDTLSIATTSTCSMPSSLPSTSSTASSSTFLLGTPIASNAGLLAIQSQTPPSTFTVMDGGTRDRISQKQKRNDKKITEKKPAKKNAKKLQQHKQQTPMLLTKTQCVDTGITEKQPQQNPQPQQQDALLGDDLHSIDFSQLVNSTVITTEDYLPSQSEPIYTANLDIYSSPDLPYQAHHQQQQSAQMHAGGEHPHHHHHSTILQSHHSSAINSQQQLFTDPSNVPLIPIVSGANANTAGSQYCPSTAIYNLHNNQLQQQQLNQHQPPQHHFPGPSTPSCSAVGTVSSVSTLSMGCQARFVGQQSQLQSQPTIMAPIQQQQQQQQSTTTIASWNPYLLAHPGASHISSTPDSGIQSIDGSPPSVYTPPMVSPYSSQVRSCESVVGNNGHVANSSNGAQTLANITNAHTMACTSYASTFTNNGIGTNASGTLNGATGMCHNDLLLMSTNNYNGGGSGMMGGNINNNNNNQSLPPPLFGQNDRIGCHQQSRTQIEQINEEEELNDFSDMPKLLPVTHMDHEDLLLDNAESSSTATSILDNSEQARHKESGQEQRPGSIKSRPSSSASTCLTTTTPSVSTATASTASDVPSSAMGTTTTASKSQTSTTTVRSEVLFHPGMSLQELAECISLTISPEQLKQLTSLIQHKAEEAVAAAASAKATGANTQPAKSGKEEDNSKRVQEEKEGSSSKQKRRQQQRHNNDDDNKQEELKEIERHRENSISNSSRCTSAIDRIQEPSTSKATASSSLEQRKQEEQKKPQTQLKKDCKPSKREKREKMVISTQPERLKAKCENLATESDKSRHTSIQHQQLKSHWSQSMPISSASKTTKDNSITTATHMLERQQQEQLAKLTAYRQRVQDNLNRKFEAFRDRVCEQLQNTHLNLRNQHQQMPSTSTILSFKPWKELNWAEIHQRVAATKQIAMSQEQQLKKKNERRKNKKANEQQDEADSIGKPKGTKRKRTNELNKPELQKRIKQEKKRPIDGKDPRLDDDGTMKPRKRWKPVPTVVVKLEDVKKKDASRSRSNKRRRLRTDDDEAQKEKKQKTPSIILKLAKTVQRGQKDDKASLLAAQPSTSADVPKPLPKLSFLSEQLAVIRSKHWFLPRNITRIDRRRTTIVSCVDIIKQQQQQQQRKISQDLRAILQQISAQFSYVCLQQKRAADESENGNNLILKRHLHQLKRAVQLLLFTANNNNSGIPSSALNSLQASSTTTSSSLLNEFDCLHKNFISTVPFTANQCELLRCEFLQLKRNADFTNVANQLQREQLQMFMEDRRRSLPHPHQQQLQSSPCSRRDGAGIHQRSLTVDTTLDLSYMDSTHPVGQWDPDGAAKFSPNSDNRDHDCVRCICGMAEDEGTMTQCDRCHFWLHEDCLDEAIPDNKEFICDFCTRLLGTTPRVDIVLKPQPQIKLSGCTYFRTLVNTRGLQVRLNEAVYVERLINDKHKNILRELHEECVRRNQQSGEIPNTTATTSNTSSSTPTKQRRDNSAGSRSSSHKKLLQEKGTKNEKMEMKMDDEQGREDDKRVANHWWQSTVTEKNESGMEFHRKDLRVFRVERLFVSPNGQRFIFGCYYARPHETFCDSSRMFYRNELFWTPLFDTLPLDSVVGRCLILEPQIWALGRPIAPRYLEDDVYVCEYQIGRNQRSFEKIQPKNRYYINTESYVFNVFPERLHLNRNFTPFQVPNNTEKDKQNADGTNNTNNPVSINEKQQQQIQNRTTTTTPSIMEIRRRLFCDHLERVCTRILKLKKGNDNNNTDESKV